MIKRNIYTTIETSEYIIKRALIEYIVRKTEEKRERDRLKYSKEYQVEHPDNK